MEGIGLLRDDFEDYARGIGIVLVVYGHVLRGLMSAGIVHADQWIAQTDYAIYTFHMPLFFVLSGLHVERSLKRGRLGFLTRKVETVVYPYLLWSILQGLVQWAASGDTNHPFTLAQLMSILWDPFGQFWFLYALFLCQVFVCVTGTQRVVLVPFAVVAYVIGSVLDYGIFTTALKFFLFFAAGILLAGQFRDIVARVSALGWIALVAVMLWLAIGFARDLGDYNGIGALPATTLGVLLVCQLALRMSGSVRFAALKLLGVASMPIYLGHILGASGARVVLMHLHVENLYVHLAAGMAMGLAFPLALYFVAARVRFEKRLGFPVVGPDLWGMHRSAGALN
ncbi:acyltransferase [Paraburkholderia kururiensis]